MGAYCLVAVMPGLVPGIHVLARGNEDVDGRVKPGHDEDFTHDAALAGRVTR
jgi:hypothetical protein